MNRRLCSLLLFFTLVLQACFAMAADPGKVLRYVFPAAETGFDPAVAHDLYSSQVMRSIYETLYTYDYLARPVKLVPLTAAAMPQVTDGGKTYTIRIKKGIYFADDPAFNRRHRELIAEDYVYSIKRLMDPSVRSAWTWLVEGKIKGLDTIARRAERTGAFDYGAKVAGIEATGRYTLRIRLNAPDFNLPHILAHYPTSAMAREVVEKYKDTNGQVMANPVGTGPYLLTSWERGSRIVLDANPGFRGFIWNFTPGHDPGDRKIVAAMKGKRMPQIGRVDIRVIPEDQSRWLSFQNGEIDLFNLDGPLAPRALENGRLRPELEARGVILSRIVEPELSQYYFNMQNPVLGGFSKEKIALRRAIAMAHNVQEEIDVVWNGQGIQLQYPIPPGIVGHDPHYRSSVRYEPALANALLDKFGYRKGRNGWRTMPDGQTLTVVFSVRADSTGQQQAEMWKKTFDSIGIRMESDKRPFPELMKAEKQCQLMMRTSPWIADYPDGDNFMQLFYGPNTGKSNNGCMQMPEFDRLYEQSSKMPPGKKRDILYHKMTRLLEVYAPTRIGYARYRNMLAQPYVVGYKKHPIMHNEWIYIDIDKQR